jgi:23S rRNA maturation-related 3'-5' exoribonuclease YhaM
MKNKIISLLKSTDRPGMGRLIDWMECNGFFTAPCSSQYHLSKEGGLAEHSLNVFNVAYMIKRTLLGDADVIKDENLTICALLHDIGKAEQYGKPNYIENMVSDRKGGYKQSDKKPYITNAELFNVPHEIRSLSIIDRYIDLTEEEQFAILYHNGLYGSLKYEIQGRETPLYLILHFADMWCSRVIEVEKKESE